jgi:antitoxin (DNA-binding transcriptional repressor) of toxin-antitoxin stability system
MVHSGPRQKLLGACALMDPPLRHQCSQVGVLGATLTGMSTDATELSVSQARDKFSDAVNRAAFGGEVTYITRGRGQQRAAAIVPAELVERYEAMVDAEDGRIATERLADLDAGRTTALPADEVVRALGL